MSKPENCHVGIVTHREYPATGSRSSSWNVFELRRLAVRQSSDVLRPRLREIPITFILDGVEHSMTAWSDMSALEALRLATNRARFHSKCEMGVCGTCEVHVNGAQVRVCALSAEKLDGTTVTTA
jgi:ferredoxin